MKTYPTSHLREAKAANILARKGLSNNEYLRWKECRHSHRLQAFFDKTLVVFKLLEGSPRVLDTLTCIDLNVGLTEGFTSTWVNYVNKEITISHTPREVYKGCFIHHLQESPVEYSEYKGRLEIKFPVVFNTFRSPNYQVLLDDSVYMLEDSVYDSSFGV